jgi:hypothetical protein
MLPILMVHGYSSEGKKNSTQKIYGTMPKLLRKELGTSEIQELDLSRWISLSDGIALDDVSFAMDRALKKDFPHLLESGFHVIIHSTGALVVRNWIRKYSPKPCPIHNLIHLAGANFGSGLAHIGKGQLARWGRFIFTTNQSGMKILEELEFGSWDTIDLHRHFLEPGNNMYHDYQVQEFCLHGSQTFSGTLKNVMGLIPIRYVKEDSSDNTVRTSSCNLNYQYVQVTPASKTKKLNDSRLRNLINRREGNTTVADSYYEFSMKPSAADRTPVPFGLLYETAHFGDDIGIIDGEKNRRQIIPMISAALKTPYKLSAYKKVGERYNKLTQKTLKRAQRLKRNFLGWNKQAQYEGHLQVIFRIRDQYGNAIDDMDITFNSLKPKKGQHALEGMIEDKHCNRQHKGTITFYFRTTKYDKDNQQWVDKLENLAPLKFEITAYEADTEQIAYVPVTIEMNNKELRQILKTFSTTIIDVTMMRLPRDKVFIIEKH